MRLNASLLKCTVVAALGGLLFGFDSAVIAGATHALTGLFQLSNWMLGFTVAASPLRDGGSARCSPVIPATGWAAATVCG